MNAVDQVVVAICTARRPLGLRRLLLALRDLEGPAPSAVVVVDNDDAREGLAVCDGLRPELPWPLVAVFEPQPGISNARNQAVRAALAHDPQFIAMLDDDEWPTPGWLRALMEVQRQTGADAVGGPVVPVPERDVEHWDVLVQSYGLLRDLPDGAACTLFGAGNFVARRECFDGLEEPFATAFDRIGGEDLHFFGRLSRGGRRMAWSTKAVVYEETPADRLTREWLLKRQHRRGFVNVQVQRRLDPSLLAETSRLVRSLAIMARAAARRAGAPARREPHELLARMDWEYALGRLDAHRGDDPQRDTLGHGGRPSTGE